MKVPSHPSNRSTKRSNLIRERPLTSRRDLIRPDFRGAGIQFPATQPGPIRLTVKVTTQQPCFEFILASAVILLCVAVHL